MKLPNTAYILLWFPKPSETFIFSEITSLTNLGLPISVYTLYGKLEKNLSSDMRSYRGRVIHLGMKSIVVHPLFICYWLFRSPAQTVRLIASTLFRKWKGVEKTAENGWALLCAFFLAYRFEKDQIQHIHAPWACGCATAAWFASSLTGIPFSFTIRAWDIYPPDSLIGIKSRDALLVRSETQYNINCLHEQIGCSKDKMHLTRNGVPMHESEHQPQKVVTAPFQLLAVGRFVGKKGYQYLFRGCEILRNKGVDFHLDMVGDGNRLNELKRLSSSLGLASYVTFHGFQPYDQIPKYFRQADFFIMPSIIDSSGDRDGIPTVLLEALLYYVPVVATPVSGIPELVEDGVTGLLVPPKDPDAIAEAVLQLISDQDIGATMAKNGHDKVVNLFNAQQNHQHVLALYNKYLN